MPKTPERKKVEKEGSRLWKLKRDGVEPRLPEVSLQYLVDYLYEVGPTSMGGFGPTPLTHQELAAWQANMRRPLQPWELDFMRRLSIAYVAEGQSAADPDAPAPWSSEDVSVEQRRAVAMNMRAALRGSAK